MTFRKYDHVERLGRPEVADLEIGEVFVFPKLDGTNASIWVDPGGDEDGPHLRAGSRIRQLEEGADNAGFWQWVNDPDRRSQLFKFFMKAGVNTHNWILYGEWLVPHTLRTYREECWRRFYVFDVFDRMAEKYVHYNEWSQVIEHYGVGLNYIPPLLTITNPTDERLQEIAGQNTYLLTDGAGAGEGIVCKNYDWQNRYGRQQWAKIVLNEFKEKNRKKFGHSEQTGSFLVEAAIAEEFVTADLVSKTRAKILNEIWDEEEGTELTLQIQRQLEDRDRGQIILQLLGRVFHDVVQEDMWAALKRHNFPTVNFKRLRSHVIAVTKTMAKDLF